MTAQTETRQDKHEFWMQMAQLYKTRATCKRRKCSALFVKDNRLVVAGYNSAPSGQKHCTEVGCLMVDGHCKRCNHAERAAIDYAANTGIKLDGAYGYISGGTPCITCAHGIIATRTRAIYVDSHYPDEHAIKLLSDCGIPIYEPCIVEALTLDGSATGGVPGWQRVKPKTDLSAVSVNPDDNPALTMDDLETELHGSEVEFRRRYFGDFNLFPEQKVWIQPRAGGKVTRHQKEQELANAKRLADDQRAKVVEDSVVQSTAETWGDFPAQTTNLLHRP